MTRCSNPQYKFWLLFPLAILLMQSLSVGAWYCIPNRPCAMRTADPVQAETTGIKSCCLKAVSLHPVRSRTPVYHSVHLNCCYFVASDYAPATQSQNFAVPAPAILFLREHRETVAQTVALVECRRTHAPPLLRDPALLRHAGRAPPLCS